MAITASAQKALERYSTDAKALGRAIKYTIASAVNLTEAQRRDLTDILTHFWGKPYECPAVLDIKPQHGFQSRVEKDGYAVEDFVLWFVAGCSDVAVAGTDGTGRPRLVVDNLTDDKGRTYSLVVIISCDAHGHVHINDVIPKGLPPRHKKKQTPRRIPKTVPKDAERRGL